MMFLLWQKIRISTRFELLVVFNSIITHNPSLSKLTEFVLDPEQEDGQRIPCSVFLTRGVKNSLKKRIVNACLMFVAHTLRMKVSEGMVLTG